MRSKTAIPEIDHIADVRIEDDGWTDVLADLNVACHRALLAVFEVLNQSPAPVGLLFTDDAAVRKMNATYRNLDKPTNVLSFPSDPAALPPDQSTFLGDIALARETVLAEAAAQGKTAAAHTHHLIVHGALHLLGHDHLEPTAAEAMEALEHAILGCLGYGDPYAEVPEASRR
jgi:probable rRNA maturation factor